MSRSTLWTRAVLGIAAGSILLARGASPASLESVLSPTYANVEVVSVDAATRLVVIKSANGAKETFDLDDALAGAAGVKAGDRVIMTVRGEPGRRRVSAITKVAAAASTPVTAVEEPVSPALVDAGSDLRRAALHEQFAGQVASLSRQASAIDAVWASFVNACGAKTTSGSDGGRDWFGLWDGRVKADLSSGSCRDLFNQIVTSGEGVKKAMAAAEDVARRGLVAGEVREIRRLYAMDWEGWELPPPAKPEL